MADNNHNIDNLSQESIHSANISEIESLISRIGEIFSNIDFSKFDIGSDEEYFQEYLRQNTQRLIISALKISMVSLVANEKVGIDHRNIVYAEIDSIFISALKLFQFESPSQPNLTVEHLNHGFDVIVDEKYSLFSQIRSGNEKLPNNIQKFPRINR